MLQFNNIQLSDAGRYRCTAVNSAGEADAVADVIVEGTDYQSTKNVSYFQVFAENIHRPTLTAENRQQTAPQGSSITLRCRAQDTNVINNIRWFREQLPLPDHSRVSGEYLYITNIQPQDEGRYYCEIPTDGGSSSDYIDVRVTSKLSVRFYCFVFISAKASSEFSSNFLGVIHLFLCWSFCFYCEDFSLIIAWLVR